MARAALHVAIWIGLSVILASDWKLEQMTCRWTRQLRVLNVFVKHLIGIDSVAGGISTYGVKGGVKGDHWGGARASQ
jgi:hypothetical protein